MELASSGSTSSLSTGAPSSRSVLSAGDPRDDVIGSVGDGPGGDASSGGSESATLMLRNLPRDFSRRALLGMLDSEGFAGAYNFVYLPVAFQNGSCFGYAFVGFVDSRDAVRALEHFQGFTAWGMAEKACQAEWSGDVQGLSAYVEKYRNSSVMHESVPDEHKPAIFVNGVLVPFPAPTRRPKAPRARLN